MRHLAAFVELCLSECCAAGRHPQSKPNGSVEPADLRSPPRAASGSALLDKDSPKVRPSELPRELASRKHECLQVVSGRRHPSCNGSAAGMAVHFCSSFRAVPCNLLTGTDLAELRQASHPQREQAEFSCRFAAERHDPCSPLL